MTRSRSWITGDGKAAFACVEADALRLKASLATLNLVPDHRKDLPMQLLSSNSSRKQNSREAKQNRGFTRQSNRRWRWGVRLAFELLEPRIALSAEPAVFISGPELAVAGEPYELQLIAPGNLDVTGWTVDWGDGGNPDGGDPGEDFAADALLATHTYLTTRTVNITAVADIGGGSSVEAAAVSAGGELIAESTIPWISDQRGLEFGPDGDLYVIAGNSGSALVRVDGATLQEDWPLLTNNAYHSGVFINEPMGMTFRPDGSSILVSGFQSNNIVEVAHYDVRNDQPEISELIAPGALYAPRGLEFGPDGNLYIAASGRLQIDQPCALALGPDDGLIYVTDERNVVQRFEPVTGAFVDEIDLGLLGSGLEHPWGLTFGTDRNNDGRQDAYVSDGSGRVFVFDPVELQVELFSDNVGAATATLFGPDSTGDGVPEMFVADAEDNSVKRIDGDTGQLLDWVVGNGAGGLTDPTDMLLRTDSDGIQRLYVSSGNGNSVLRFDPDSGELLDQFVTPGSGGLAFPVDFMFGPDGNGDGREDLYVSSRDTDQLLRYDGETGAYLDVFVGAGAGGLDEPNRFCLVDDRLWVAGGSSNQLHLYDAATGAFEGQIASQDAVVAVFDQAGNFLKDLIVDKPLTAGDESGGLGNPGELHFHNGDLYVASRNDSNPNATNGILRYDADGTFVGVFAAGSLGKGSGFEWGPDGRLYVSDVEKHQILIFDGDTGAEIGVFAKQPAPGVFTFVDAPFDITFGADGRAYVADTQTESDTNNALFQLEGPLIPRLDAANEPLTALAVNVTASVTNIYEHNNATPLQDASPHSPGVTTSMISVPDGLEITDVNVTLDISHTNDADLDVFLIAPDGTRVELFTDVGGSGDNFAGTTLDDEAGQDITSGAAPFTGVFRPEGNLAALVAKQSNGVWTLEVSDDSRKDTGVLNSWSLEITGLIPAPTPGITVQPTSGRVTTEDGGADQFTIVLDSPPTDNVTIDVSTSDASEGLVASGARPGVHGDAHLHAGQLGPAASGDHHRAR